MTFTKSKLSILATAVVLASTTFVPTAQAEVSASVSAANMYLWRGIDLGAGDAAISGDITYSNGGFYTGIWGSSGDAATGNEYDLYLGYGGEAGNFSYDVSYWTYIYPSSDIGFDDAADLVVSLGYGGANFTVYENISEESGADDTRYITLGYDVSDYSFLVGQHDNGTDTAAHVQASYAYNENVSFTASKFLDENLGEAELDDDVQFVVSYSFDIK